MASKRATIADTSFYIFFIDDIDGLGYLTAIAESCMLVATALVMKEISRKRSVDTLRRMAVPAGFEYEIGETLRPFFETPSCARGEHEVIAFGHVMHKRAVPFTVIIDDAHARRFAMKNFAHLGRSMTGTLGFVVECHKNGILTRDDAERVLNAMKQSRFRVPDGLVDEALLEVRGARRASSRSPSRTRTKSPGSA